MNINKVIFGYRIVNANIINCRITNSTGRQSYGLRIDGKNYFNTYTIKVNGKNDEGKPIQSGPIEAQTDPR